MFAIFYFIQKLIKSALAGIFGVSANGERNSFLVTVGLIILFVALVFGAIFSTFDSCRSGRNQKKIEKTKEEILIDKTEANAINGQRTNVQTEVNNAASNTNNAFNNFDNSVNRDSSQFDGNTANSRFCKRFPLDSSCR